MSKVDGGILLSGLFFCPFAGAVAFLITYEEYQRHRFGQRQLVLMSLQAAVVATLFFALVAVALSVLLPWGFGNFG